MSSENSPTSPRENVVCIPTICLDSLNDSCASSDQYCATSESETDQSFGINVSNFLSWLSYCGSQRRFLVAAILTENCEPGFRRALQLLNSTGEVVNENSAKEELISKANDYDYISSLKSADLSSTQRIRHLLDLLPYLSLPSMNNFSCVSSRRISTASALDHTKEHDLPSAPNTSFGGSHLQLSSSSEKSQSLKKQYLNLIGDSIGQVSDVFAMTSGESSHSLSDSTLKELVMQQPLSQLLMKVFFHPGFTREDRHWLCSLIRAQQQAVNLESVAVRGETPTSGLSDTHTLIALQSKAFDCLLEALFDLSVILHSTPSHTTGSVHFVSSLSHSLTSSGFLSGCGGSGSQYDLLSEATNGHLCYTNQNSNSQYGTLLTVPTPDPRVPNHHFGCSAYPGLIGALEQRRLSDGPYILSQSLATSTLGNEARAAPSRSENNNNNNHARTTCAAADYIPNPILYAKTLTATRASLPNALAAQYPVETITEHTSDSVSLSSASSTFSSNLDLRPVCHHRFSMSANKSVKSAVTTVSNHDDSYVFPPSPPSTVSAVSSTDQMASVSSTITPIAHNCSTRIQCSLACADHSLLDHSFHGREFDERTGCDDTGNQCIQGFEHDPDAHTFTGHDSSPEPHLSRTRSNTTEESTSFSDPSSPMSAVPGWLKSLRLHKYASLFQHLSYDEFMGITESWLEERNVTQGARTKLLLNIRKLTGRGALLQQVETNLLQAPSAGLASLSALHTCLTEIFNILHTPMRPCLPSPSTATAKCASTLVPVCDDNAGENLRNKTHIEPNELVQTPAVNGGLSGNFHMALGLNTPERTSFMRDETEYLPHQIMSCLTKVCSRLLVSPQPDLDCCEKFIQLLDIVSGHPAFLDKQKSLIASWRQQMFNLLDTLPFHLTSNPSRSSRSIPRSYHGGRPFRKPNFAPSSRFHLLSKKGSITCCSAISTHDALTSISTANSDPPCTTSSYSSMDPGSETRNLGLSAHQTQGCTAGGRAKNPVCPLEDNSHRRHSVPVNQVRPGPQPITSCQGRRMPSPNPAFMPSRNAQFFFPGQPQASSSSEADVSQPTAMQVPRTRFPSPSSAYEHAYSSVCPRGLIPPATAPPTRMPSPSDVRQHSTTLPPPPQEVATSMLLAVPISACQASLTCPCATALGPGSRVDESVRAVATLVQQNSPGNLPFQTGLRPDSHQQPHSMFQRNSNLPGSVPTLDCTSISTGLSDLHQKCSLQTPSNPYLHRTGVNSVTRHDFEGVRGVSQPLSCAPLGINSNTYPSVPHDNPGVSQSGRGGLKCVYHSPVQTAPTACHCLLAPTPATSDTFGANATGMATTDPDWCTSTAGQLLQLPRLYPDDPGIGTLSMSPASPGMDTRTEFIEHNLDLLTRKVTELAIGEFDSPGE